MREYRVNGYNHIVYDSIDEAPPCLQLIKNWRKGNVGDWVLSDDECIIQVIRKGQMLRRKGKVYYIGTCTGTFISEKSVIMDTDKRPNIYSFGGTNTPYEVVERRRKMTASEEMFVQYITSDISPEEAYVKAFPTNNRRYARMKAVNLIKTERIKTAMKEELKPICEELGISDKSILEDIRIISQGAEKDDTKLKALFKLADILDLEDKNTAKVQQITGVQFQGFTEDMLEEADRKKKLPDYQSTGDETI